MSNTIIPVLLWNISEKKWFTVGFSCTKWHYLILVTLSADNHRLLDFLFRFPKKYFLVSGGVSRKNWKWITALDRVATMIQIMHEFLFFFPKLSPLLPLVVWYYIKKKFDYVASNDSGKNHMKVHMCWDRRSTFRLTQSQTQVNLKMVQRRLYSPFELHLMTSSVTVRILVYTGKSRRIVTSSWTFFVFVYFLMKDYT